MAKAASSRSRKPAEENEAEETQVETQDAEVTASEPDQAEEPAPAPEAQTPAGPRKLTGQEAELAAQIFCQLVTTPMAVGKDPAWLAEAAIHSATVFGQVIQSRT